MFWTLYGPHYGCGQISFRSAGNTISSHEEPKVHITAIEVWTEDHSHTYIPDL